jgi:hypothetical protein
MKTSEHVYETCARFTKVGIVVSSGFYSEENRSRSSWSKRKVTFLGKFWGVEVRFWGCWLEGLIIGSESLKLFWDEMWSGWKLILKLSGSLVKSCLLKERTKMINMHIGSTFMLTFMTSRAEI